ncbi:MAG: CocE/NonD family hydrolase, partial [Angustibacter sp.]
MGNYDNLSAAVAVGEVVGSAAAAAATDAVRGPTRYFVTMPDGVVLATDVYLPAARPSAPAVLLRTPYGRARHTDEGRGWARRGYAFVVQDVRGRADSGGQWRPYHAERSDGCSVVHWVASQSWCDGRVIPAGGSYAAFAAWAAALETPDHVVAVLSSVPAMGTQIVNFAPSGPLALYRHTWWWSENGSQLGPEPNAF